MKVQALIDLLEGLNPNEEVFFLPANGVYAQDFSTSVGRDREIRTFFGKDKVGTIIFSGGQVGAI